MARYVNPFPQYINISGSPITGGFLKFFDTGTNNPKNVFSDSDFSTNIGSEVRLDGSGRVPALFINGAYKVTLTDVDGNEIDSADPIGIDTDITNFDLWDISNTYNIPDIVRGSDNLYYQSMVNTNLGNDPTALLSAFWEQFFFLPTWNIIQTYSRGQLVINSDDGRVYLAQQITTGQKPSEDTAGTFWEKVLQNDDDIDVAGITISKINANTSSFDFNNDTVLRWRWLFDIDISLDLERYNSSGVLQDKVLSFNNLTGATTIISDITNTGNFTVNSGDITFSQDGNAAGFQMFLTSDTTLASSIEFQDVGVRRWELGQNNVNNFALTSYDSGGVNPQTIFLVANGAIDLVLPFGNLSFLNASQGFEVLSSSNSTMDFNFTGVSTATAAFEFFDETITTGSRLVNVWKGNTTNEITFQVNAEDGSIHTAFDRAGEADTGVKLGKITLSTADPSGGEDGDLWLKF